MATVIILQKETVLLFKAKRWKAYSDMSVIHLKDGTYDLVQIDKTKSAKMEYDKKAFNVYVVKIDDDYDLVNTWLDAQAINGDNNYAEHIKAFDLSKLMNLPSKLNKEHNIDGVNIYDRTIYFIQTLFSK